jgi:D-serine deaminase-like pyridoxal phosphate-dependent protein
MTDDFNTNTPVPIVDLDIVALNIERFQKVCDAAGVLNMPHFKTHKSLRIAKMQLQAGAAGITCQKLGEAEVLADGGFKTIFISYNILGAAKVLRLQRLAQMVSLSLACDNVVVARFLSDAVLPSGATVEVLVDCDTGNHRTGVITPQEAVDLACLIDSLPGLTFGGLMVYTPFGDLVLTRAFLAEAVLLCAAKGLKVRRISAGGTPGIATIGQVGETEYRAGTNVYNDRMTVGAGAARREDCALLIHAMVISNAEPGRAILDAGSKVMSSDIGGQVGFGELLDYPEARFHKMTEEHGFLDISACLIKPQIGEIVRILPNHVCPISNLQSEIGLIKDGKPAGRLTIDARGASK